MRFPGMISPAQAAERLRVSKTRVLVLCHQSLEKHRSNVKLPGVERTETGRFLIPLADVEKLKPQRR